MHLPRSVIRTATRSLWLLVAALLVSQGAVASGSRPRATKVGRIVFAGTAGNSDIYTINADGTGRRRLTWDGRTKMYPSWSPDGTKIVYTAFTEEGPPDVFVVDANGRNNRRLTR